MSRKYTITLYAVAYNTTESAKPKGHRCHWALLSTDSLGSSSIYQVVWCDPISNGAPYFSYERKTFTGRLPEVRRELAIIPALRFDDFEKLLQTVWTEIYRVAKCPCEEWLKGAVERLYSCEVPYLDTAAKAGYERWKWGQMEA